MGSDLYISIETQNPGNDHWRRMWEGPSTFLARGIVVDAFGDADPDAPTGANRVTGYVNLDEAYKALRRTAPWRDDEPYWVRFLDGQEFVSIVREKRWQKLQDGDFHDTECDPELRAFAVFVESLMAEGLRVRVWCWHSQ